MTRSRLLQRLPVRRIWSARPSQTVGTPADTVTPSWSNSADRDAPSSAGPGSTSFAPTSAAENGSPQALTWNIGTTGTTESDARRQSASGSAEA